MTDETQLDVGAVVIGAGAAGLATATMLQRKGLRTVVLERADEAGSSWVARYDALRLNSVRWMSTLPGYRMERRYGRWPSGAEWAAYLQRYARRQRLDVRYGVQVDRVERTDSGFAVQAGGCRVGSAVVVVATGHDHTPSLPAWPGAREWRGRLMHSAEFRNAEPFRGQHVLVVGTGNSGCEIAALLSETAASVSISVRTPPLILRREHLGIPVTVLGAVSAALPDRLVDAGGRLLQRLAFGDLRRYGLPPSPRGLSQMRRSYWSPPVDSGFVAAVKRGAVTVVAAVEGFAPDDVLLADGTRLRPDTVLAATGYTPGLQPLVGHLDVLDPTGQPRGRHPERGLFFAGFTYGLTALLPHVEQDARLIAQQAAAETPSDSGPATALGRLRSATCRAPRSRPPQPPPEKPRRIGRVASHVSRRGRLAGVLAAVAWAAWRIRRNA